MNRGFASNGRSLSFQSQIFFSVGLSDGGSLQLQLAFREFTAAAADNLGRKNLCGPRGLWLSLLSFLSFPQRFYSRSHCCSNSHYCGVVWCGVLVHLPVYPPACLALEEDAYAYARLYFLWRGMAWHGMSSLILFHSHASLTPEWPLFG